MKTALSFVLPMFLRICKVPRALWTPIENAIHDAMDIADADEAAKPGSRKAAIMLAAADACREMVDAKHMSEDRVIPTLNTVDACIDDVMAVMDHGMGNAPEPVASSATAAALAARR